jgi:hypothetical protein
MEDTLAPAHPRICVCPKRMPPAGTHTKVHYQTTTHTQTHTHIFWHWPSFIHCPAVAPPSSMSQLLAKPGDFKLTPKLRDQLELYRQWRTMPFNIFRKRRMIKEESVKTNVTHLRHLFVWMCSEQFQAYSDHRWGAGDIDFKVFMEPDVALFVWWMLNYRRNGPVEDRLKYSTLNNMCLTYTMAIQAAPYVVYCYAAEHNELESLDVQDSAVQYGGSVCRQALMYMQRLVTQTQTLADISFKHDSYQYLQFTWPTILERAAKVIYKKKSWVDNYVMPDMNTRAQIEITQGHEYLQLQSLALLLIYTSSLMTLRVGSIRQLQFDKTLRLAGENDLDFDYYIDLYDARYPASRHKTVLKYAGHRHFVPKHRNALLSRVLRTMHSVDRTIFFPEDSQDDSGFVFLARARGRKNAWKNVPGSSWASLVRHAFNWDETDVGTPPPKNFRQIFQTASDTLDTAEGMFDSLRRTFTTPPEINKVNVVDVPISSVASDFKIPSTQVQIGPVGWITAELSYHSAQTQQYTYVKKNDEAARGMILLWDKFASAVSYDGKEIVVDGDVKDFYTKFKQRLTNDKKKTPNVDAASIISAPVGSEIDTDNKTATNGKYARGVLQQETKRRAKTDPRVLEREDEEELKHEALVTVNSQEEENDEEKELNSNNYENKYVEGDSSALESGNSSAVESADEDIVQGGDSTGESGADSNILVEEDDNTEENERASKEDEYKKGTLLYIFWNVDPESEGWWIAKVSGRNRDGHLKLLFYGTTEEDITKATFKRLWISRDRKRYLIKNPKPSYEYSMTHTDTDREKFNASEGTCADGIFEMHKVELTKNGKLTEKSLKLVKQLKGKHISLKFEERTAKRK